LSTINTSIDKEGISAKIGENDWIPYCRQLLQSLPIEVKDDENKDKTKKPLCRW